MQKITPHLWFDKEAKESAEFYTSVFPGSKIKDTSTIYNTPSGTVDIVTIELLGQEFMLISGGPFFKFNEAVSFMVSCDTQKEVRIGSFALEVPTETELARRLTYELMAGYWPTPDAIKTDPIVAEKMNSLSKIVFSRTLENVEWNNTTLVKDNVDEEIKK